MGRWRDHCNRQERAEQGRSRLNECKEGSDGGSWGLNGSGRCKRDWMKNAMGPNCAAKWHESMDRMVPSRPPSGFLAGCVSKEKGEIEQEKTAGCDFQVVERVEREKDRPDGTTPQVRTIQEQVLLGRVALLVVPPFEVRFSCSGAVPGLGVRRQAFVLLLHGSPRGEKAWRGEPLFPCQSRTPECKSPLSLAWRHLKMMGGRGAELHMQ